MEPRIIILLGRSGSGKGTQAKLLQEKLGLGYVGSGDLLRARMKINDFTGRKLNEVLSIGAFAPTSIVFKLWVDRWEELKSSAEFSGFIIDGSPRKLIEVHLIDQALEWYEWSKYLKIVLIDISESEATSRLLNRRICNNCGKVMPYLGDSNNLSKCDYCGGELVKRSDDTENGVRGRMSEFNKEVVPIIDYLESSRRLLRVNGEQSIEDVHKDIMRIFSL